MLRKATISVLLAGMFFPVASISYGAKKVSNHQLQASDVMLRGSITYLMNTASGFEAKTGSNTYKGKVDSSAKPTVDVGGLFMATDDIGVSLGVTVPPKFSDSETEPKGTKAKMEYKTVPMYLTGQYYFPEMSNGLFRLYAGGGFHYTMFSGVEYTNESGTKFKTTSFDNKFSFLVEGGALFAVDSTVFVDVSVKYLDLTAKGSAKMLSNSTESKITDYKVSPIAFNVGAGMVF